MEQRKDEIAEIAEIEVKDLFLILLKKWWCILLVCILGALSAGIYSTYFVTPIYTSTSKVYVMNREKEDSITWADIQSGEYLAQDLLILVKSRPVMEEVNNNLDLHMDIEKLTASISVHTPADTRIIEIAATHPDPLIAKRLVDSVVDISAEYISSVMEIKNISVVEEGNLPIKPTSPNRIQNIAIGGLIGAMIPSIILITIHLLNDTLRTPEDVDKYLGIPTLGIIPMAEIGVRKRNKKRVRKKSANEVLAS